MLEVERDSNGTIVIHAADKLSSADYSAAMPKIKNFLELSQTPPGILVLLEDFRGWEVKAFWDDIKFDIKHGSEVGPVAVVGENAVEEWGTKLTAPFFPAEIKYFPRGNEGEARTWLDEVKRERAKLTT